MDGNPYQSPNSVPERNGGSEPFQWLSYSVNSIVVGALAGSSTLLCYIHLIVVPPWRPMVLNGDDRIDTLFFIPGDVLPVAVLIGIVIVAALLWRSSYRLKHRGIIIACFAMLFVILFMRPVVSRRRRPDIPIPKYELVPDLILIIVVLLAVVTLGSALVQWIASLKSKREQAG